MTPSIMINNLTSRRVGETLFQGKVTFGFNDRFDLVWNGLDLVFKGFRANAFPAGFYSGLKIFEIPGVGF
jgi:hypothetical protein